MKSEMDLNFLKNSINFNLLINVFSYKVRKSFQLTAEEL